MKQGESIISLDELPSWDEIKISAKQISNNKALRMNGITSDVLKCSENKSIDLLKQVIHDDLLQKWMN